MNNRNLIFPLTLIILFMMVSCSKTETTSPGLTPAATEVAGVALASETGINFLIDDVEGVKIKRSAWNGYQSAGFGTAVQRGDLILPPDGTTVAILCADLIIKTIDQENGSPCKVAKPALTWDGARIVSPRAPDSTIPYALYPRSTYILDSHPLLRWYDTGAGGYTVAIIQAGKEIWRQEGVNAAQLRYPDDAPPLEPGVSYLLKVVNEETGASSEEDPVKGLNFRLLPPERAATIIQTRDEIMALSLDAAAQNFALTVYYAGQGVYGEALGALNETALTRESPQLLLWNGRILADTYLYDEAETAYTAALALAETLDDIESQAQAQVALSQLTGDEGYLETAIALYQELGDEETITNLRGGK